MAPNCWGVAVGGTMMIAEMAEQKPVNLLMKSRNLQFWSLQLVGWLGLSLVTFFSLNLWYNQPELAYILHNLLQSLGGIVISWPLRYLFSSIWDQRPALRFSKILIYALLFSLIWTAFRTQLFTYMTGEDLSNDFGGWFFASFFIFLSWSALYHGIKYYRLLQEEHAALLTLMVQSREESLRLAQAESVAKEAQLKMLRYQLNPHFLFNTLNAISSLVVSGANEMANTMLLKLSQFLRYSLDSKLDHMVDLDGELAALSLYLNIEQVRFGDRLQVIIDAEPSIKKAQVPGLLMQPLVENSIKYAISMSEKGGVIEVSARREGDKLKLVVKDQGPDEPGEIDHSKTGLGVGLSNTLQRLETLYADQQNLQVSNSESGGACVTITLPYTEGDDYASD